MQDISDGCTGRNFERFPSLRIGVLAPYPAGSKSSGIADYTAALLRPVSEDFNDRITIFADRLRLEETERDHAPTELRRCWRSGWLAPFEIARALLTAAVDVVHVEYDIYLFGGILSALLIPLTLFVLRVVRKVRTVVTVHGVVPVREITTELLRENGLTFPFSRLGRVGFRLLYRLIDAASDAIIVLERPLAAALVEDYGFSASKVKTLPHPPMRQERAVAKARSATRAGGESLLYFGYASHYKGLPVLVDAFSLAREQLPDLKLTLVAGPHPRLAGNVKYDTWYEDVMAQARAAGIVTCGWLDADAVCGLLSECAALVLPYTRMYGASGPLNTALAGAVPILASTSIYFDGADPAQVFDPTPQACAKTIVSFFLEHRSRLEHHARLLAACRSLRTVARDHHLVRRGDPASVFVNESIGRSIHRQKLTIDRWTSIEEGPVACQNPAPYQPCPPSPIATTISWHSERRV